MKRIGIFNAKTHLTKLCSEVESSGVPLLVERRGRPLVMISPVPAGMLQDRADIYAAWKAWEEAHPGDNDDFPEVWKMRRNRESVPVDS